MSFIKDFLRAGLIGAGIKAFGSVIIESKQNGTYEATKGFFSEAEHIVEKFENPGNSSLLKQKHCESEELMEV